jgi:hypothetical protein
MHLSDYSQLLLASLAPVRDDVPAGGSFNELLAPEEAAQQLKMAKQTLARWRVEGTGPLFVRLGNRVFYRSTDLHAFVAGRVFTSTAEADRATA